jgi:excisionase family DNA binding protein
MDTLVVSVAEAAHLLGVSDDLVYELVERGELPCVRFGRRRLIPRRALDLVIEAALVDFDPSRVVTAAADHHRRDGLTPASALPAESQAGGWRIDGLSRLVR